MQGEALMHEPEGSSHNLLGSVPLGYLEGEEIARQRLGHLCWRVIGNGVSVSRGRRLEGKERFRKDRPYAAERPQGSKARKGSE